MQLWLQLMALCLVLTSRAEASTVPLQTQCLNSVSECTRTGSYPMCGSCAQFVKCLGNGGGTVFNCPMTLHYDVNLGLCQYPSLAVCGSTSPTMYPGTGPTSPTVAPGATPCISELTECSSLPIGQYPWCGNCRNFVYCFGGRGSVRTCPHNLFYDAVQHVCNYQGDAICSTTSAASPTSPTSLTSPTSPTSLTSPTSPTSLTSPTIANCITSCSGAADGFLPSCSSCSKFWVCFSALATFEEHVCDHGLEFDDNINKCVNDSPTCNV